MSRITSYISPPRPEPPTPGPSPDELYKLYVQYKNDELEAHLRAAGDTPANRLSYSELHDPGTLREFHILWADLDAQERRKLVENVTSGFALVQAREMAAAGVLKEELEKFWKDGVLPESFVAAVRDGKAGPNLVKWVESFATHE